MAPFDCHITQLDDARLAELAEEWRRRALRGERAAYGTAQVLEAEERRRDHGIPRQVVSQAEARAPARPWWRFWLVGG